jgi:hypothetical protein
MYACPSIFLTGEILHTCLKFLLTIHYLLTWGSYRLLRIQWLSQLYLIRLQVSAASSSWSMDFLLLSW